MKTPIVILLLIAATSSQARTYGNSNFSRGEYDSHRCTKPYRPYSFTSSAEVDIYNYQRKAYIDCVNEYIDGANNDIQRIKESAEDLLNESKSR